MKRRIKNDHKVAAGSNVCCSLKHCSSSTSALLPGLSDHGRLNICSSTSAESSTVGSGAAPSQQPINQKTGRNLQVLKIKLPCSGDGDGVLCVQDDVQYEDGARDSGYGVSAQPCASSVKSGVVCSMCGDEGIAELLFLCCKCFHRPQHIYCSRSYPDLCDEASICNWCLHESQNSLSINMPKERTKLGVVRCEANADSVAGEVRQADFESACRNANKKRQIIKEAGRNHEAQYINRNAIEPLLKDRSCTDEVSVSIDEAGHGRAFEYLLMIAAESLRQVMGEAHAEIKQINHRIAGISTINISTDHPKMGSRQIKEPDQRKSEMETVNINISTAKMGDFSNQYSTIKLKINKNTANMGDLSNQHSTINVKINKNTANMGDLSNQNNTINVKINKNGLNLKAIGGSGDHDAEMGTVDEQKASSMGDCGAVFVGGSHISRRQRCSKAGIHHAPLKCRKKGLQLSPSRPNYRRYKLLADVVC